MRLGFLSNRIKTWKTPWRTPWSTISLSLFGFSRKTASTSGVTWLTESWRSCISLCPLERSYTSYWSAAYWCAKELQSLCVLRTASRIHQTIKKSLIRASQWWKWLFLRWVYLFSFIRLSENVKNSLNILQVSGVLDMLLDDVCQPFYYDVLDLAHFSSRRRALKVVYMLIFPSPRVQLNFKYFLCVPASCQASSRGEGVQGEALLLPLGFTLHLGDPPETEWDGHFLLGDGNDCRLRFAKML